MKDYDVFLSAGEMLQENREIEIEIRDAQTLATLRVRALVSNDPSRLPDGDRLWVRRQDSGDVRRQTKPWAIQVLSMIEDTDEVEVQRTGVPLHRRQGFLLRSLLQERQGRVDKS